MRVTVQLCPVTCRRLSKTAREPQWMKTESDLVQQSAKLLG